MATNDFLDKSSENFEQKWLWVILVDVSASMSKEALAKLNKELCNLYRLIKEDETSSQRIELCVMTFGQEVRTLQEPALVENFAMLNVVRDNGIIHAIDCAVEKIKARKCWYKEIGQHYYRPCLVLVSDEANERLLYCDELKYFRENVQQREFDFLMVGMDGSSVYAHSTEIEIKMKDDRSLAQMLFPMWEIIKWGDDACEMPLPDGTITGLTVPPPDDTWMEAFEN